MTFMSLMLNTTTQLSFGPRTRFLLLELDMPVPCLTTRYWEYGVEESQQTNGPPSPQGQYMIANSIFSTYVCWFLYFCDSLLLTISNYFIVTRKWKCVKVRGSAPSGRTGHSMVVSGSKLFIIGGQADGEFMNDLWAFDLALRKCFGLLASDISLTVSLVQTELQWTRYKHHRLNEPTKRTGHVCVAYKNQIIL
jgi:hypothetical protein